MPSTRLYVGVGINYSRHVFSAKPHPSKESHPQYLWAIGPFKTRNGARFMALFGNGNPHCRHVQEAERLAQKFDWDAYDNHGIIREEKT